MDSSNILKPMGQTKAALIFTKTGVSDITTNTFMCWVTAVITKMMMIKL